MSAEQSNLQGNYGDWLRREIDSLDRPLSFYHPERPDLETWKRQGRAKLRELMALAGSVPLPEVRVARRTEWDGLAIEELQWDPGYGPPVEAYFIRPAGAAEGLPGVVALHDHGANKYFGKSKIARVNDAPHPHIREHQRLYYSDRGWATELARRGYAVLVHDVFPFESRRVLSASLPPVAVRQMMADPLEHKELTPEDLSGGVKADYDQGVERYNGFAIRHEETAAKSLLCAGLTFPGVYVAEDLAALNVLASRPEVDPARLGCGGLSGGGMRTHYLAALDDRIRCCVSVGFMTTFTDFALWTAYTHTWMIYVPLLSRFMDFPEVLGLRVPLPSMVLVSDDDPLFTRSEVSRSEELLSGIYAGSGAAGRFAMKHYPGPHRFDAAMQEEAFHWFDRWLKGA